MIIKKLYHKLFKFNCGNLKSNKPVNAYNILEIKNQTYGVDKKNNIFDFYFSNDHKKHPTIFMIHGGGYVAGQKEDSNRFINELLLKNFNVVNFEYTKCDDENKKYMPQQVFEAFECFKVLQKEEKFSSKIDFNNFYIAGDSAGGHIASLIANIQTNDNLKFDFNLTGGPKIKGVILICPIFGPYEFKGFYPKNQFHDIVYGKENDLAAICHSLDVLTNKFPPSIIVSMPNDFLSRTHVKMFCKKAKSFNLPVKFCDIKKGYKLFHDTPVKFADRYPKTMKEIENFIVETSLNIFPKGLEVKEIFENDLITELEKLASKTEERYL
ncbi:MAG: alpha/beta hydrolase [Clostridia bacterium]|nr:alpha/beta hydrolase [Clostridia bacterium]